MVEIAYLSDHPETIPTLAAWFRAQWPAYYGARTLEEIAQDFQAEANHDVLPVRLVAFLDGELAGTATLRERALQTFPSYHPGLGGFFVIEQFRNRRVGYELVSAVMQLAKEHGYSAIYAATVVAGSLLERLGWKQHQQVWHHDEKLTIYCCALEKDALVPD
jgi:GNAT superfamily N-acetyltransferase